MTKTPKIKRYTAEQLKELTPAKLEAALAKASHVRSHFNGLLIEAGRGHERLSETRDLARQGDTLAIAACEAEDASYDLYAECSRRKTYHGSLRRTP